MPVIARNAHYDGRHVQPDKPWLRAASTAGALNFLSDPAAPVPEELVRNAVNAMLL